MRIFLDGVIADDIHWKPHSQMNGDNTHSEDTQYQHTHQCVCTYLCCTLYTSLSEQRFNESFSVARWQVKVEYGKRAVCKYAQRRCGLRYGWQLLAMFLHAVVPSHANIHVCS